MANAAINSLHFANNTYTFTLPYGVCGTAATDKAKTVTVDNFSLETGATVIVKFTYANSIASPTLNVNSTGAKPIYRYGTTAASTGTTTTGWVAGAIQMFTYDGTGWIRDYWNNTTYTNAGMGQGYATCNTAAGTIAKVASLSSYALTTGGIVAVKFTYGVVTNATLNINSKGAKQIYYRGNKIKSGIITAGDIATFVYDGTYYQLLSVDKVTSNPNLLINGDFQIWQRGTSFYPDTETYTADRWYAIDDSYGSSINQSSSGMYINLSDTNLKLRQVTEISSSEGGAYTVQISINGSSYGVSFDETYIDMGAGGKENFNVQTSAGTLSVETALVITSSNKIALELYFTGMEDFTINWVKLEKGSIATPFTPKLYAEELVLCERYYQEISTYASILYGYNTSKPLVMFSFPKMTTMPTCQFNSITSYNSSGNTINYTSVTLNASTPDSLAYYVQFSNALSTSICAVRVNAKLDTNYDV